MRPPGPKSDWPTWQEFHHALVTELHTHPDLLIACEAFSTVERGQDAISDYLYSPWTNGGCGLVARALYEWIDQPRRALWMMLGRRVGMSRLQRSWAGYDNDEPMRYTYPHAIIRYKSDALGWIYFDGATVTQDGSQLLDQFHADEVLYRTKDSHGWMAENFRIDPFDDRRVELVKQVLVNAFGRWPK